MINENLTLVMIFHEIWNKNDCTCWVYQFSLLRGKYWQPGCIFSSPAAMFYSSSMANGYSRPPMYTGRHFLTLTTHCISRMQTYALLILLFFCCVHVPYCTSLPPQLCLCQACTNDVAFFGSTCKYLWMEKVYI